MSVLKGLLEYQLNAMSFTRKGAIKTIDYLQEEIAEHLVKIAIYDDTDRKEQIPHWQNEILAWLDRIDKRTNNVKKQGSLKLTDYINSFKGLGNISKMVRGVKIAEYECNKWKNIDNAKLYAIIQAILLAQYEAMARDEWSIETLTENKTYKAICM